MEWATEEVRVEKATVVRMTRVAARSILSRRSGTNARLSGPPGMPSVGSLPCTVVDPAGSKRTYSDWWEAPYDFGTINGDVVGEFGETCCGGSSTNIDASLSCKEQCVAKVCGVARDRHIQMAFGLYGDDSCDPDDCGFDFDGCVDSAYSGQKSAQQMDSPSAGFQFAYNLLVQCLLRRRQTENTQLLKHRSVRKPGDSDRLRTRSTAAA